MATLVFSTLGTAVSGPLGGAIGAMAGRQLDTMLLGGSGRRGPRLRELDVPGVWRLSHFLRGCPGTEDALANHAAGEDFALLDDKLTALDPTCLPAAAEPATILALGRGDAEPAASPVRLRGIAHRPLAPVHPRVVWEPDGMLRLAWTRRARGAWGWSDGVDTPLDEEAERYLVSFLSAGTVLRTWSVTAPSIALGSDMLAELSQLAPGGELHVRQQGTHALSPVLALFTLA